MQILKKYIDKQPSPFSVEFIDHKAELSAIFVVIPCFNEPEIEPTLLSLNSCERTKAAVTVMIVLNSADNSPENVFVQNQKTLEEILSWREKTDYWFKLEVIHAAKLPNKWAGVGWARKIGMDKAVRHFADAEKDDGIIVAFDADSTAKPNYLVEIEKAFAENPKHNFFTINFEHPLEDASSSPFLLDGIIRYELHLRYLRKAMDWCGYPHSIHTVGSSMALRASAYAKQGGMNRRKAGEDFYFLHKLVLLGPYGNINATSVIPASRTSDRVPFGTGAALKKWDEGGDELFTTYAFDSFVALKPFFENPEQFYELDKDAIFQIIEHLHPALKTYILNSKVVDEIVELQSNCANSQTFGRRFFHIVNAFWIIKYLNRVETNGFPRGELTYEALKLLELLQIETKPLADPLQLLKIFRKLDLQMGNNY